MQNAQVKDVLHDKKIKLCKIQLLLAQIVFENSRSTCCQWYQQFLPALVGPKMDLRMASNIMEVVSIGSMNNNASATCASTQRYSGYRQCQVTATPINVCMNNNAIALQRYSLQSIDPQILHRSSDLVTIRILAIKISDAVDLLS